MLAKIFEIFTKYSHVNTPIETRKVRLWPRKLKHIKYLPVQMIDIWVGKANSVNNETQENVLFANDNFQ